MFFWSGFKFMYHIVQIQVVKVALKIKILSNINENGMQTFLAHSLNNFSLL